jgi:hypothetical protein
LRAGGAAQVAGEYSGGGRRLDGRVQPGRLLGQAEVLQHQGGAADGADRVGKPLPGDVRCGAVHGLEHAGETPFGVQVGAGRQAKAAGQRAAEVGQDVRVQVGGDDDGEVLGMQHELRRHRVHEHALRLHVRVVAGDAPMRVVPQDHAVLLCVALGDAGDLAPGPGARQVEGVAHDALAADLGEQGRLHRDLAARAAGGEVAAAHAGVLTLAVLADDHPVELGAVGLAQRAAHARQEAHGADVRPLVKVLADGQPQAPQADMIGHARPADRAEVDGVELLEYRQAAGGHHLAGARVVGAAPAELLPVERERPGAGGGQRVEHRTPRGYYLLADTVPGNRREPQRTGRAHHFSPSCRRVLVLACGNIMRQPNPRRGGRSWWLSSG